MTGRLPRGRQHGLASGVGELGGSPRESVLYTVHMSQGQSTSETSETLGSYKDKVKKNWQTLNCHLH